MVGRGPGALARGAGLLAAALLGFLSLFTLWAASCFGLHLDSESFALVGAMLVRSGAVPFRDFAGFTPPGTFYLLAALFRFTGDSVLVARFALTALPKWLIVILAARTSRRLGTPVWGAVLAGAFATVALGNGTFSGADYGGAHPTVLATLLAVATAAAQAEFLMGGPAVWAFLAGLSAGLNVLIRYDLALFSVLGVCAAHAVAFRFAPSKAEAKSLRTGLVRFVWGALAGAGPAALFFLYKVPLSDLRLSLIDYPAAYLRLAGVMDRGFVLSKIAGVFHVPTGTQSLRQFLREWWLYDSYRMLSFFALAWSWAWLLRAWQSGELRGRREKGMAAFLFSGTFLAGYYVKSGNLFSFPAPFFALLPVLIAGSWRSKNRVSSGVAVASAAWALGTGGWMWYTLLILPFPGHRALGVPSARGVVLSKDETAFFESMTRAVQDLVPPDERILVYDRRYDISRPPQSELYFLFGRLPGTGFYDFSPGITDREDVQNRIVADLTRNRVRFVLQSDWPVVARPATGTGPIFDAYIARNFSEVARFGPYRLLYRGGVARERTARRGQSAG